MVVKVFRLLVEQPERLADALAAERKRAQRGKSSDNAASLRRELESIAADEKATVTAQIAGIQAGASPAVYNAVFEKLAERRNAIEERLRAVNADETAARSEAGGLSPAELARQVAAKVARLPELLTTDKLSMAAKNDVLSTFIQQIVPTDEDITVTLRPEFVTDGTSSETTVQTVLIVCTVVGECSIVVT